MQWGHSPPCAAPAPPAPGAVGPLCRWGTGAARGGGPHAPRLAPSRAHLHPGCQQQMTRSTAMLEIRSAIACSRSEHFSSWRGSYASRRCHRAAPRQRPPPAQLAESKGGCQGLDDARVPRAGQGWGSITPLTQCLWKPGTGSLPLPDTHTPSCPPLIPVPRHGEPPRAPSSADFFPPKRGAGPQCPCEPRATAQPQLAAAFSLQPPQHPPTPRDPVVRRQIWAGLCSTTGDAFCSFPLPPHITPMLLQLISTSPAEAPRAAEEPPAPAPQPGAPADPGDGGRRTTNSAAGELFSAHGIYPP